jgi:hypothetical protein
MTKIQALSLAKECYSMKLDLLTNPIIVDDAIRFVSQKSKESPSDNSNEGHKEELNEHGREHMEVSHRSITINHVF